MLIRPTAFTIGLIIYSFITLFAVYTEFGIDSRYKKEYPQILQITITGAQSGAFTVVNILSENNQDKP